MTDTPEVIPANTNTNKPLLPNMPTYAEALELTRKELEARPLPAWASHHIFYAEDYAPKRPYYTVDPNGTVSVSISRDVARQRLITLT